VLLTLIQKDAIFRLSLPEKCTGQYWVVGANGDGNVGHILGVEGLDGRWVLKSNKTASVLDSEGKKLRDVVLEPNQFYSVQLTKSAEKSMLHTEPATEDRRRFSKYVLPIGSPILIGRAEASQIRFASGLVSTKHAEIVTAGDRLSVKDVGSANGTYVNGRRVTEHVLSPGDVISVMGLSIVVGKGFIAVNNPDGQVTVDAGSLRPLAAQPIEPSEDDEIEEALSGELFFRSPRFKRDITRAVIKIDSPPQPNSADEMPLMMVIGPAATMGMASLFTGLFALNNVMANKGSVSSAMPTLVMSFSMVIGMVLWPILSKRYEKKSRIKKEAERQEKYRVYLARMRDEIERERTRQSQILCENVVTVDDCVSRIRTQDRALWERTVEHDDFLRVRLGVGDWPLDADINYAARSFSVDEDDLQEEMLSLAEEPRLLRDVPVSLSLREQPIVGLIGQREDTRSLLKGLIAQLIALHSYDELKLVFILDASERDIWDYVSILPHAWADDRSIRFIATDQSEVRDLSAFLDRELTHRNDAAVSAVPHYLVFALDKDLAGKAEVMNKLLSQKAPRGFSVVALYDELHNLPKECSVVVEVDPELSRIYDKDDVSGDYLAFKPDIELTVDARELAECIANTHLESVARSADLPDVLTFLEMFGAGKVEHLNALARWKESNPVLSLAAPVGVDVSGEVFKLDLHEKHHGPHGLIAGMTGSGKSEFIMSYILSLAVNFHPDEVAFVLIDYKGGGMANAFADLPHVAGTITNLDGAAVNRSLVSIQSELKRRQALFNEAGERTGTSNIDIYKYQSLYRDGAVEQPLPHLLIISDEFAELKTQQPEFMTQLVSAARIGRSLGVHLILATQKPSGVVDDQIWSNSRFRVCLKVQESADSMEVIKRPDAAALAATGRFYVQVGFNELFELGQSAWAGAPYYPADRVEHPYDSSVALLSTLGQQTKQFKLDKRKGLVRNPAKQIDEVTKYLMALAEGENALARPLWLEPIPEFLHLDALRSKYAAMRTGVALLNPVIGEFDDPANQRQAAMTVPISAQGNTLIFGSAGSGKTTLLTTMLYSMMSDRTPSELNLYLLDFASETLRAFADAPHVGDVILSYEAEKVHSLFKMLGEEIERRKRLFSDYGGDFTSYLAESGASLESVVVAIHNYAAFSETYEDVESDVAYLTREGSKYGIYFVFTASSAGSVRYRVLQNFSQILVLRQNDETEYSGILGNTEGVLPSPLMGRGIFRSDKVYEFQTAHVSEGDETDLAFIRRRSSEIAAAWDGPTAKRVPILPDVVTPKFLADQMVSAKRGVVAVGLDKSSLAPVVYDFWGRTVTLVLSRENETAGFAQGLAESFAEITDTACVVLDADGGFVHASVSAYECLNASGSIEERVLRLFDEVLRRNNAVAEARESAATAPTFDAQMVLVFGLTALLSVLSSDAREKFATMVEKSEPALGCSFILMDSVGAIGSIAYEPWLKESTAPGEGIWVGDGLTDQYVLAPAATSSELYEPVGPQFGYVLCKGKPHLAKLVVSPIATGAGER